MDGKKRPDAFVSIIPQSERVGIRFGFRLYTRNESDGTISCAIPPFNIFFSAADKEMKDKKAKALTYMYFNHYMLHSKNGLKKLVLDLHKIGFKANNDLTTVHNLINNKIVAAKFKLKTPAYIPDFSVSEDMESELAIAE